MNILLSLLEILGIVIAASIFSISLIWLYFKLTDRIFGEYASLRPFDYVGGLVEDFLALFEDIPGDWRDLRRWRRESEARQRERDRENKAIIAERERQDQVEREKQTRSDGVTGSEEG